MSEPIGWNLYSSASAWDITKPPQFIEFIPNEPQLGATAAAFADEVEAYAAKRASCDAVLFPLPPRVPSPGFPVHPLDVVHFGPVHGPAPAACAREPHPDSPWHWDGRGTWWH
ncbi:MAG TPA: hypothetical protein VMI73_18500 [Trebonia sp.]|nr:hypothetical protein [Trebonia sp.]